VSTETPAGAGFAGAADLGPARVARLDATGQFAAAATLGDQLEEAWRLSFAALEGVALSPAGYRPNGVAVCGMGGSAIGGDVVKACLTELPVPCEVVRGYDLPAWVSPRTLVIAVSYSGDTEETLSCVSAALARECRPVCVTSGGTLEALARERGLPLIAVPAGHQPRAAMGLLAAPVGAVVEAAGLATGFAAQVDEAAGLARELAAQLAPEAATERNPAKRLALRLHGRLPVIYGGGLTGVAARRFKSQLNENADAVAFWAELPELNHNELVGWSGIDEAARGLYVVIFVDHAASDPIKRRVELTRELVARHAAGVEVLETRGEAALTRVLSLTYLGDYASLYLAMLRGIDPAPVEAIDWLKRRMAGDESASLPDAPRRA